MRILTDSQSCEITKKIDNQTVKAKIAKILKYFILSVITLGIYPLVKYFQSKKIQKEEGPIKPVSQSITSQVINNQSSNERHNVKKCIDRIHDVHSNLKQGIQPNQALIKDLLNEYAREIFPLVCSIKCDKRKFNDQPELRVEIMKCAKQISDIEPLSSSTITALDAARFKTFFTPSETRFFVDPESEVEYKTPNHSRLLSAFDEYTKSGFKSTTLNRRLRLPCPDFLNENGSPSVEICDVLALGKTKAQVDYEKRKLGLKTTGNIVSKFLGKNFTQQVEKLIAIQNKRLKKLAQGLETYYKEWGYRSFYIATGEELHKIFGYSLEESIENVGVIFFYERT